MHLLVVSYKNGSVDYFGPFPTFFRANEYGLALAAVKKESYARHHVVNLILPHTMQVRFK